MSLDTVALVMEIEKRFEMRFENDRMSRIETVEQIAGEVCRLLGVEVYRANERETAAAIVHSVLPGRREEELMEFPLSPQVVGDLARSLEAVGCLLPVLGPFKSVRVFLIMQDPGGTLESPSIEQFIDRIVAYNHQVLIPSIPPSRYGVLMVVLGIVAESTGVPILRIALEDSLTIDLGLD
jgi:acyl carrier protein